jgi:SAM-dependent methyltransferase
MSGIFKKDDVSEIKQSVRKDSYWTFIKPHLKGIVTEIGCGTGANAILAKNIHSIKRYNSFDGSNEMLDFLRKEKLPKVKIFCENIDGNIKLPKCDVILSKFVFHHIKNKKQLIDSCYLSLNKNGKFIIIDKIPIFTYITKYIEKTLKFLKIKHIYGTHYYCSKHEFLRIIKKAGFKIEFQKEKKGKKLRNFYVKRVFWIFRK